MSRTPRRSSLGGIARAVARRTPRFVKRLVPRGLRSAVKARIAPAPPRRSAKPPRYPIDDRTLRQYCEYLTFRSFLTGYEEFPADPEPLRTADELRAHLEREMQGLTAPAILLSGGMDSANLAAFMPRGSTAYTIFHGQIELNELDIARSYCEKFGLEHKAVLIDPDEYLEVVPELIARKGMPLSPAEPIVHIAARIAVADGHREIVNGAGADAPHGGFTRFRHDLPPEEFARMLQRFYLLPKRVLTRTVPILDAFTPFLKSDGDVPVVDSGRFLRKMTLERFAFRNAIEAAGGVHVAPYTTCATEFDSAENALAPKVLIRGVFQQIFGHEPPAKLALQKPVGILEQYRPTNPLFKPEAADGLSLPRRFLIHCLEQFELQRLERS